MRGCDHGVSLGVEPKLRTVLWGWAGEGPLLSPDVEHLEVLHHALSTTLARERARRELLTVLEVRALRGRVADLLDGGRHQLPTPGLARHPVAGAVTTGV